MKLYKGEHEVECPSAQVADMKKAGWVSEKPELEKTEEELNEIARLAEEQKEQEDKKEAEKTPAKAPVSTAKGGANTPAKK